MFARVTSPKDFWAGLIYIGVGMAALWIGADYKLGTAGRMGPGYFPKVLAGLLILIGLIALIRSLLIKSEPVSGLALKPMFFILAACGLFAVLLAPVGLIGALLALCLVAAAGSRSFAFDWKATAGLVILITFCALVFVKGLGVPLPLIGSWISPLFEQRLPPRA